MAKIARPAARIGLAVATAGTTEIAAAFDPLFSATGSDLEEAVDQHWAKAEGHRAAMQESESMLDGFYGGDRKQYIEDFFKARLDVFKLTQT
ncbi:MAG: hypothetical protein WBH04_01240 [Albidovulum sp.]